MTDASTPDVRAGVRHEALLYATFDAFVEQVGAFVDDGDRAGEPVLVLVDRQKADALREHLGRRELVQEHARTLLPCAPQYDRGRSGSRPGPACLASRAVWRARPPGGTPGDTPARPVGLVKGRWEK